MKTERDNQLARVEQFLGKLRKSESSDSVILLGSEMETIGASNSKDKVPTNGNCTNNRPENCRLSNGNCANYESACGTSSNVKCLNLDRKMEADDWQPHKGS